MTGPESRRPFNGQNLGPPACFVPFHTVFSTHLREWIGRNKPILTMSSGHCLIFGESLLLTNKAMYMVHCTMYNSSACCHCNHYGGLQMANNDCRLLMHYISTTFSTTPSLPPSLPCAVHIWGCCTGCNAPHVVRLITMQYQDCIVNVQHRPPRSYYQTSNLVTLRAMPDELWFYYLWAARQPIIIWSWSILWEVAMYFSLLPSFQGTPGWKILAQRGGWFMRGHSAQCNEVQLH